MYSHTSVYERGNCRTSLLLLLPLLLMLPLLPCCCCCHRCCLAPSMRCFESGRYRCCCRYHRCDCCQRCCCCCRRVPLLLSLVMPLLLPLLIFLTSLLLLQPPPRLLLLLLSNRTYRTTSRALHIQSYSTCGVWASTVQYCMITYYVHTVLYIWLAVPSSALLFVFIFRMTVRLTCKSQSCKRLNVF